MLSLLLLASYIDSLSALYFYVLPEAGNIPGNVISLHIATNIYSDFPATTWPPVLRSQVLSYA
jgi:hypothetical protein